MARAERWPKVAYLAASLALLVAWGLSEHRGASPGGAATELTEDDFRAGWQAMVGASQPAANGRPVVRVSGDDVYLLARRWEFSPDLLVAPKHSYRFHFLAEDVMHSAAIGGVEILLPPGQVRTLVLTTPAEGHVSLQCGEYCGLSHSRMTGSVKVVAP